MLLYEKLIPVYESDALINPLLFETTGGFEEILETTPDKAFSQLKNQVLCDFEMAVRFIKIANRIGTKEEAKVKIQKMKVQLKEFTIKWDQTNVGMHTISWPGAQEAVQFIKEITAIIEPQ